MKFLLSKLPNSDSVRPNCPLKLAKCEAWRSLSSWLKSLCLFQTSRYLEPDRSKAGKHKTAVLRGTCNPVWDHVMKFENVGLSGLKDRCLELTVWDHETLSSNEFLGGTRLNLGTGKLYSLGDYCQLDLESFGLLLSAKVLLRLLPFPFSCCCS